MSFEGTDFRLETLDLTNPFDVKLVKDFLTPLGFDYNKTEVDSTIILYNLNKQIVATGSHKGQILKYVAVAPAFRETTAFPKIVTELSNKLLILYRHAFVFTKPETAMLFKGLGFCEIESSPPLFTLLEFGFECLDKYLDYLKSIKKDSYTGKIAAIVVNCNPFTNGHKFLIEKAAEENELVYLFVVEEDRSAFPFAIRWQLIEKGIAHLKNVIMVKGGNYVVSGGIFPSYFLKNENVDLITQKQAELDVKIFAKYIVPLLDIKRRYVGTENYCVTTAAYNKAMLSILPTVGVQVIEVIRIASGIVNDSQNYISASKVRKAIRENKLNTILDFLPDSTRDFLLSEKSEAIRNKIIGSEGRH